MSLTLVTGFATLVGVAAILAGVAWLRAPETVHELQVSYLGSSRRDASTVRRGSIPRGIAFLVLGALCLTFVVVSV
jgi:drug/metabolite transporter (DMT)-like permease